MDSIDTMRQWQLDTRIYRCYYPGRVIVSQEGGSALSQPFPPNKKHHQVSGKIAAFTDMDPLKKLAAAVLFHASKDAQKGCAEARQWLLTDEVAFPMWCRAYGVCPVRARKGLRKAIGAAPLTRKRRRELVIQALKEAPHLSNREIGRRLKVNYETVRRVRLQSSRCRQVDGLKNQVRARPLTP